MQELNAAGGGAVKTAITMLASSWACLLIAAIIAIAPSISYHPHQWRACIVGAERDHCEADTWPTLALCEQARKIDGYEHEAACYRVSD